MKPVMYEIKHHLNELNHTSPLQMLLDNLMRESSKIICVSKFMIFQFGLFFKTSLMHPSIIH